MSVIPLRCALCRRHRGVGHPGRLGEDALDPAQADGEGRQLDALQQPRVRVSEASSKESTAPGPSAWPAGGRRSPGARAAPGSGRARRCAAPRARRRSARPRAGSASIRTLRVLSPRSVSQQSCGPRMAPKAFWIERMRFPSLGVVDHGKTADHVAVAVEELGAAVQDDVAAQLQRALQVGGHEGVVHQGDQAVLAGESRRAAQVGDLQQRVGGGLQVDAPSSPA